MPATKPEAPPRPRTTPRTAGPEPGHTDNFTRVAVKLGHLSLWLGFLIGATLVL